LQKKCSRRDAGGAEVKSLTLCNRGNQHLLQELARSDLRTQNHRVFRVITCGTFI